MSRVLVITGFGPFNGVEKNPTQEVVEQLREEWTAIRDDTTNADISIHYDVVEVSVEGCDAVLTDIANKFPGAELTLVHLGVDARSTHIKLEEVAYNNMTFRVPDQRNYQPQGKPIQQSLAYDLPLQTCWNIPALIRDVTLQPDTEGHEERHEINPSTDPGRFLCNYIYFRSLIFRPCGLTRSIFIHVPPFEHIKKEHQVKIVKRLAHDMALKSSVYDRNLNVLSETETDTV
jgi:pyroglutamyl-peptidase